MEFQRPLEDQHKQYQFHVDLEGNVQEASNRRFQLYSFAFS